MGKEKQEINKAERKRKGKKGDGGVKKLRN